MLQFYINGRYGERFIFSSFEEVSLYLYNTTALWDLQDAIVYNINNFLLLNREILVIFNNFSLTFDFVCDMINMLGRLWKAAYFSALQHKRNDP